MDSIIAFLPSDLSLQHILQYINGIRTIKQIAEESSVSGSSIGDPGYSYLLFHPHEWYPNRQTFSTLKAACRC